MVKRFFRNWAILALIFALAGFGAYFLIANFNLFFAILIIVVVLGGLLAIPVTFSGGSEDRIEGTSLTREQLERVYDALPEDHGDYGNWAIWWKAYGMAEVTIANALARAGWDPKRVVNTILSDGPDALTGIKNIGKISVKKILRWLEDYHSEYMRK